MWLSLLAWRPRRGEAATSRRRRRLLHVPRVAGDYTILAPGATFELQLRPAATFLREPTLPETPGTSRSRFDTGGGLVSVAPGLVYSSRVPEITSEDVAYGQLRLTVRDANIDGLVVPMKPCGTLDAIVRVEDGNALPAGALEVGPADAQQLLGIRSVALKPDDFSQGVAAVRIPALLPGQYSVQPWEYRVHGPVPSIDGDDYSRQPISIVEVSDTASSFSSRRTQLRSLASRGQVRGAAPLASVIAYLTDRRCGRITD